MWDLSWLSDGTGCEESLRKLWASPCRRILYDDCGWVRVRRVWQGTLRCTEDLGLYNVCGFDWVVMRTGREEFMMGLHVRGVEKVF